MQIGIIADDLTSAADAGAPFARTGHSVAVGFGPAALQANVDALALDLDARRGSICRAVTLVEQSAAFLGPSPILYLTMDSTLRGHIGAQVAAALRASGRRIAIVAPAFPARGRTTLGGAQFVDDVPVHKTRFAQDLRHPVKQSRIRNLFDGLDLNSVVELARTVVHDGRPVAAASGDARLVVADAATNEDLDALVAKVPAHEDVLWVGSPGLAHALARAHPGKRLPRGQPKASRPLVVVGSLHSNSRAQVAALVAARRARAIETGRTGSVENAGSDCLADGPLVGPLIVRSPEALVDDRGAVAAILGRVAARLVGDGAVDGVIAIGGDTALAAARALGATGLGLWGGDRARRRDRQTHRPPSPSCRDQGGRRR